MRLFKHAPGAALLWFSITLPAVVLLVALFNILIDPYGLFRIISIQGINSEKPIITSNARMAKAHVVHYLKPTAIIFGTSRAEMGIDPDHIAFKNQGYETYNMAMAGSGLYEIFRNVQHAYYASDKKLRLAIVGLDFLMFNANRERIVFGTEVIDYDEKRLILSPAQSYLKTSWLFDLDAILFIKATRASIQTIRQQNSQELHLANGMRHPTKNMLFISQPLVGHRYETLRNEKYYMEKIWTAGPQQRFCFVDLARGQSVFDTFRHLLDFARENNIELRFFMSPTHARTILAIKEAGLWDAFEEFKRSVVNIIAEDTKKNPSLKPIALWDFMNFNSITTEPFPELSDKHSRMKWYWEMSHYKTATGNLILDRVMNDANQDQVPPDFGVQLTQKNVVFQLQKTLHDSEDYEKKFPADAAEIKKMAIEIFANRPGSRCSESYKLYYQANTEREQGHEVVAMNLLRKAVNAEAQERQLANQRHLPYREIALNQLIQSSLAGKKIEQPLTTWVAYQERGIEKANRGDLEGAILDFTEAIHRGPKNTALYYLRGTTFAKLHKHTLAIKDYKIILATEPQNQTVKTYFEQSQLALSNRTVHSSKQSMPLLDCTVFQERGLKKVKNGDLEGDILDLTSAIKNGPPNNALYYTRATTLAKLKKYQLAIRDLQNILKDDLSNETVKFVLKQCQASLLAHDSSHVWSNETVSTTHFSQPVYYGQFMSNIWGGVDWIYAI